MKRSEMIQIIKDYLDLVSEEPKDTFSTEEQAEYILGCCETWGMSPPLRDRTDYEKNILGTKEDNFDTSLKKRTWDEE